MWGLTLHINTEMMQKCEYPSLKVSVKTVEHTYSLSLEATCGRQVDYLPSGRAFTPLGNTVLTLSSSHRWRDGDAEKLKRHGASATGDSGETWPGWPTNHGASGVAFSDLRSQPVLPLRHHRVTVVMLIHLLIIPGLLLAWICCSVRRRPVVYH